MLNLSNTALSINLVINGGFALPVWIHSCLAVSPGVRQEPQMCNCMVFSHSVGWIKIEQISLLIVHAVWSDPLYMYVCVYLLIFSLLCVWLMKYFTTVLYEKVLKNRDWCFLVAKDPFVWVMILNHGRVKLSLWKLVEWKLHWNN